MTGDTYTARAMIERLVGFQTVSANSNLALIDFVEAYLQGHGIESRRTIDTAGTKANLFASLGPESPGGVVLSGHTDVVPVEGQNWSSDPFTVVERNGRLYGRGTADMKSFLAIALALVPEFLAAPLRRPIHLALSYDEEVGCLGVGHLIDDMKAAVAPPTAIIIGEPTLMGIATAHKSCYVQRTQVTGQEAHSSQPQRGGSAILAAGELVHYLGRMAGEYRAAARPDSPFEPPYTTLNIGTIEGGKALNIIARDCAFTWEFRALPEDDPATLRNRFDSFAEEEVLPRLREFAPEARIVTETLARVPPLAAENEGAAEALVRRLRGANRTIGVSFGTEGGLFQNAGFSTVVCGPGSIDQAHQPDEFIEIDQVEACADFLRKLRDWATE